MLSHHLSESERLGYVTPALLEHIYASDLVENFDWMDWPKTSAYLRGGIPVDASHDDVRRFLTVLVRRDRFFSGSLKKDLHSGLLRNVLELAIRSLQ